MPCLCALAYPIMADLQPTLDKILDEVLKPHLEQIRAEMSKRLSEEMEAAIAEATPAAPPARAGNSADITAMLNSSVLSVQGSTSQTEILGALLDGTAKFAMRVALFVVRGGTGTGWQGRGFDDESAL